MAGEEGGSTCRWLASCPARSGQPGVRHARGRKRSSCVPIATSEERFARHRATAGVDDPEAKHSSGAKDGARSSHSRPAPRRCGECRPGASAHGGETLRPLGPAMTETARARNATDGDVASGGWRDTRCHSPLAGEGRVCRRQDPPATSARPAAESARRRARGEARLRRVPASRDLDEPASSWLPIDGDLGQCFARTGSGGGRQARRGEAQASSGFSGRSSPRASTPPPA
jgi:hypothetical protein